jgi:Flp pilus assembly protein TadB
MSEIRWIRRRRLADRLAPYAGGRLHHTNSRALSVASLRDVVIPACQTIGERAARLFGVSEDLSIRLRRIHSPIDASAFRLGQIGSAGAALIVGGLAATVLGLSAPFAAVAVAGLPVLVFLIREQQVATASAAWRRRLFLELPVIAEQLGMLTTAGWSLGGALARVAQRGSGNCAKDLRRVIQRMQQGLGEVDALREWAALADVDALTRLVSVLALNREAADLGRLVSEEARSIRRDAQRELIETIEQRNQQVWIPVTVAALIPGVLLIGVPFVDALTLFSSQ